MSEFDQPTVYGEWPLQPGPFSIRYPIILLREIDLTVKDAARRISHGGMETGGFLFGRTSTTGGRETIQIEAFRPIECEHAFGPSFVLSERDLATMRQQLLDSGSDPGLEGMRLLGWFVGHARNPLRLSDHEAALFDRLFPRPGQLTLLVKPERFAPSNVTFILRGQDRKVDRDGTKFAFPLPSLSSVAPPPPEDKSEIAPVPADFAPHLPEALELGAPSSPSVVEPTQPIIEPEVASKPVLPLPFDITQNIPLDFDATQDMIRVAPLAPGPIVSKPIIPEPSKPEPIKPEPVEPEAIKPLVFTPPVPEPIVPEPIVPALILEPSEPEPIVSESLARESIVPKPIVPEPIVAEPIVAEPSISEPTKPEPVKPESVGPLAFTPAVPEQDLEKTIAPEESFLVEPLEHSAEPGPESQMLPEAERSGGEVIRSGFLSLEDLRVRRLQRLERSERVEQAETSEEELTPRPPTFAVMQKSPTMRIWKPLVAFLIVLAVCGTGFWLDRQYFAPSIPLQVDDRIDKLTVSWPADETRDAGDVSIRVDGGAPTPLSMEEKVLGRAEVAANGDEVQVELIIHHWFGDVHGRARFVKPVITALP